MPTIRKTTALAANGQANPLVGSQYEYLPWDALVQFAVLKDSAGAGTVEATIFSGSDVLLEQSQIDEKALSDPVRFPDDYDVQDVAAAGERINVTLREISGNVDTVRTVVRITPL